MDSTRRPTLPAELRCAHMPAVGLARREVLDDAHAPIPKLRGFGLEVPDRLGQLALGLPREPNEVPAFVEDVAATLFFFFGTKSKRCS